MSDLFIFELEYQNVLATQQINQDSDEGETSGKTTRKRFR
jgi:hypothetical protein